MATVLVPLAQGCEELEAVTIVDLLRRAGLEVITAGLDEKPINASHGMVLIADMTLTQAMQKNYDMIVLPGGLPGADNLNQDLRIHALLKKMHAEKKVIAAVCAAPKVLAKAGLLDGRQATSFPGSLDGSNISNMDYLEQAVVIDGQIITSRGPGTTMDFALTLIEQLLGPEKRAEVEAPLQRPA
ncbi:DJ-1/YajL/PfpI superfamily, includes chaperone protein YajL (former ThiJ), parkinsonism-associated protein DJ-1, peptidases PfpI, Hsp31 [hydrothermal vent metagenome]|uniref:DJ-1/YajL/PfpI superfamily, includes chaperone protein YajL (Former ThiJ), parkinsonism-associated protein DJ-1, peptidases PfpI, Hsp31 n=1 Tax=hydrothermal vent metagenome TaxID=652676 RepID=A0A3B1BPR2_9ZZZZ